MPDTLVFRLVAPLASWGIIAVGESRHSVSHPGRSAVLGLLAAALGLRREDDAAHASLASACRFGVKVLAGGFPLRDFHTVQTGPELRKQRYRTRRQELTWSERSRLGTMLSAREYLCDSYSVVAVQTADTSAVSLLSELCDKLHRPVFPLYLGRRSCPPAAPLSPKIVSVATLKAALDVFDEDPLPELTRSGTERETQVRKDALPAALPLRRQWRYYWDSAMGESGLAPDAPPTLTLTHHDEPLSRLRWQFGPRQEFMRLENPA